jgi:ElaB/YqjD/DUF883 family membrane-anchored ribosome-binding protein
MLTTAQILEVQEVTVEPEDLVVYDEKPSKEEVLEAHDVKPTEDDLIIIDDLPGAPPGTLDPQIEEVVEVDESSKEPKIENDWNWSENKGEFVAWVKEKITKVPKHSGYDIAGLERAISYLEKLDSEISKAMRADHKGVLDANLVEEVRSQIESGIDSLQNRIDKVKESKKSKKKTAGTTNEMVKSAGAVGVQNGIVVTVPLLIARIARVCVNSAVSAGHDMGAVYQDQVKKYSLNLREQAELQQLLSDMGVALPNVDFGYAPGEERDLSNGKYNFVTNYNG